MTIEIRKNGLNTDVFGQTLIYVVYHYSRAKRASAEKFENRGFWQTSFMDDPKLPVHYW